VEKFVFNIELPQNSSSASQGGEEYCQQIEEELRVFLLKISLSETQLPPINPGCPFQILLHVSDPVDGNGSVTHLRRQSQIDESGEAWIAADATCAQPQAQVVALRSMCVPASSLNAHYAGGSRDSGGAPSSLKMELVVHCS
jgi:hypothetical protein